VNTLTKVRFPASMLLKPKGRMYSSTFVAKQFKTHAMRENDIKLNK